MAEKIDLKKVDLTQLAKEFTTLGEINDFLKQMTKGLIEKMLEEEMKQHLGYGKHAKEGNNSGNSRNGKSGKKVRSSNGEFELEVPRDRNGNFKPQLVKPYQTDISEFDQKIISMYARGMTTRDIQSHVEEIYGAEISPAMVSIITSKVMDEARQWQQRPLSEIYVVAYFDALFYKVREHGKIVSKAAYVCLGINAEGTKEILGLWLSESEGASFWLGVLNELKSRGVNDIFISCIDGLNGLSDAIKAVFPKTDIQRCIIHMIRSTFKYIPQKHRAEFLNDLKAIYTALSETDGIIALNKLIEKWETKYPLATKPWVNNWEHVATFFKYPPELRKMIYTTNAVESFNRQLRKVTKNRSILANDDSLFKILYLAARDVQKKWHTTVRNWQIIVTQLHLIFGERFTVS